MLTVAHVTYSSPDLDIVLSALANPKRRGIIHELSLQPATVGQLATRNELSLPAIHRHIRALENAKLITRKKIGRTNFVALNSNTLGLLQNWINQYHTTWGQHQSHTRKLRLQNAGMNSGGATN
jgi:DNA-binding transcriptional ArsR family regulator